jgi:hypothetical protein
MVGLLAAPLTAWSQTARDDARQAGQDTKQGAREAGQATKEGAQSAGQDARDTTNKWGDQARKEGQETRAGAAAMFDGKDNFEVKGKISQVSANSITIRRDDDKLPPVKLNVEKATKVELDGNRTSVTQLAQGADVKASFNLREDKPIAVEIKAQKTDQQKHMKDQREHMRDEQQNPRKTQ